MLTVLANFVIISALFLVGTAIIARIWWVSGRERGFREGRDFWKSSWDHALEMEKIANRGRLEAERKLEQMRIILDPDYAE